MLLSLQNNFLSKCDIKISHCLNGLVRWAISILDANSHPAFYTYVLRPYYTMCCFTWFLLFLTFCIFPPFFPPFFETNMLVSKREEKRKEKAKKMREDCPTQHEKMFLYYTIRWVKTRASCIFLAFFSRFCSQTLPNA